MILIQSSKTDYSTNEVLDWIYYLSPEANISRFNDNVFLERCNINIATAGHFTSTVYNNNKPILTHSLKSYWYRRSESFFRNHGTLSAIKYNSFSQQLALFVNSENDAINEFFNFSLSQIRNKNGNFVDNGTNKLINLYLASSIGMQIPDTLISNDFNEIGNFLRKYPKVITKHISQSFCTANVQDNLQISIIQDNEVITPSFLNGLSKESAFAGLPCKFQQYIDKQFELRIFYLRGKFYTMAILSQENEKTQFDFRNYDQENPNRCVPFTLPKQVKIQLKKFMKKASLDSGSIDMIYTPDDSFVFLEVNPVGQYQWLAKNCNYGIDKKIAEYLIK